MLINKYNNYYNISGWFRMVPDGLNFSSKGTTFEDIPDGVRMVSGWYPDGIRMVNFFFFFFLD